MAAPCGGSGFRRWLVLLFLFANSLGSDQFNESLLIKPLNSGHVISKFDFVIGTDNISGAHFHLVPRHLAEVISHHHVQELHLSLTQGFWRHDIWGYPARQAGTGAQLWVWFDPDTPSVDESWSSLVNALSGLFCASLNFMDRTVTTSPEFAFRPAGVVSDPSELESRLLRVASLPREATCTENLTPWQKLLPCGAASGLSTLLNPTHLYSTSYHSLSVDFRPVCADTSCSRLRYEITQSVTLVHEPVTTPRRDGPRQDWSMKSLFGRGLYDACAVAERSDIFVDTAANGSHPFVLSPAPHSEVTSMVAGHTATYAAYSVTNLTSGGGGVNLRAAYSRPHRHGWTPSLPLTVTQYQTGSGQYSVGLSLQLRNADRLSPLDVSVLQVVPWYIRLYLHTLQVTVDGQVIKPVYQRLVPGRDRQRPYTLELGVRIPAGRVATVSVQAERAFLKWHEYPPDANHGFYLPGAVVSALLPAQNCTRHPIRSPPVEGGRVFVRLSAENQLVTLPTPDFSMPYNVICLVCTVVALAFGPLHNICTKRLLLVPVSEEKPGIVARIKSNLGRLMWWRRGAHQSNTATSQLPADVSQSAAAKVKSTKAD
ncbi:GPI transamidase component PIG-T-like [Amphibalanus amphitrite]|uniref:GPI transamidase component PIG-T-like n=1 Tax=Amphibalanus amphitrite TaxID=1232801 RepID=UPI001C91F26F|nr:GPI transamidase component PIG-T-like [Amphibalanus amphitrite]XP_043231221.1 GPI transamidase component PIG-T-like [Amphibalanus amphitrite]